MRARAGQSTRPPSPKRATKSTSGIWGAAYGRCWTRHRGRKMRDALSGGRVTANPSCFRFVAVGRVRAMRWRHNNAPNGLILPAYRCGPPVNVRIRHALQRVAHCFGMGDMGQSLVNARNGQPVGVLHQGAADVGGVGFFHANTKVSAIRWQSSHILAARNASAKLATVSMAHSTSGKPSARMTVNPRQS